VDSAPRKKLEKKNEKKTPEQKSTRDFAKGGNRGSPPRPRRPGEERSVRVRRHAGASRLPPPLLVFAIATTPRLGTIWLRARASALHRGAQADRAGVLVGWGVGEGRPMLFGGLIL